MYKKLPAKLRALNPRQRTATIAAFVLIIAAFIVLTIPQFMAPPRSVAAYCKAYSQEKARLAKLPGDAYPSGVFNLSVSDAGEMAKSFRRLERVAPTEVSADAKTLQGLYQQINDDPSKAIAASLSGASIDDSLKGWTGRHCTN